MKARSILLSLTLALVVASMAGAYHPHSLNIQTESIHGYGGASGMARESMACDGNMVPPRHRFQHVFPGPHLELMLPQRLGARGRTRPAIGSCGFGEAARVSPALPSAHLCAAGAENARAAKRTRPFLQVHRNPPENMCIQKRSLFCPPPIQGWLGEISTMQAKIILLSLTLALVAAPMAGAYHPNFADVQREDVHGYGGSGGVFVAREGTAADGTTGIGATGCWDNHEVSTTDYDGDYEHGLAGGCFPVATPDPFWGCTLRPDTVPHHTADAFWADNTAGPIVYTAGTEGADATSIPGACISNGIISDNPDTDPNDCSGETGVYIPGTRWDPATILGPNCGSFDGYAWVFIASGAFVSGNEIIISTPVEGHIRN